MFNGFDVALKLAPERKPIHHRGIGRPRSRRFENSSMAVVLVVEDDAMIRMDVVSMIEDAGFEVIKSHNGDEAIVLLDPTSPSSLQISTCRVP